jgi:hypothetical protein
MGSRVIRSQTSFYELGWAPFGGEQENGRIVRLRLSLWKTTIVHVYYVHASPWLFTISITKPFLDFVHLFLKYRSRTEATHLSPKNIDRQFTTAKITTS